MATLLRPTLDVRPISHGVAPVDILASSSVPAPFTQQDRDVIAAARRGLDDDRSPVAATIAIAHHKVSAQPNVLDHESLEEHSQSQDSLIQVQHTVLAALRDLFSLPLTQAEFKRPTSSSSSSLVTPTTDTLPALLVDLRARQLSADGTSPEMTQIAPATDDRAMMHELHAHVATLDAFDAELASALVPLLALLRRFADSGLPSSFIPPLTTEQPRYDDHHHTDIYAALAHQLSAVQLPPASAYDDSLAPVAVVERALLASQLDAALDTALRLCRTRTADAATAVTATTTASHAIHATDDALPPSYADEFDTDALPPQYQFDADSKTEQDDKLVRPPSPTSEKMRFEFDAVARAIDRLYAVAPQMHAQRAELRPRARALTTSASASASSSTSVSSSSTSTSKAKGKARLADAADAAERDQELERMVDMLGRASARRMADQTAALDPSSSASASARRYEAFVGRLVAHSGAGRMHAQDAVFSERGRERDGEQLLTLPEFIREPLPLPPRPASASSSKSEKERDKGKDKDKDKDAPNSRLRRRSLRALRSRSMSAPSMAWFLRDRDRRSAPASDDERGDAGTRDNADVDADASEGSGTHAAAGVAFVAEHHETLRHVLAFLSAPPGPSVPPPPAACVAADGTSLVLQHQFDASRTPTDGSRSTSAPVLTLPLPAPVRPGYVMLRSPAQGAHYYELKAPVVADEGTLHQSQQQQQPLLDAEQLRAAAPSAFLCATCSLPLVRFPSAASAVSAATATATAPALTRFDDLPSEHWAELVDAWMCHADQALNADVAHRAAAGFWPASGQVLVGGSYVLVRDDVVVRSSLWESELANKAGEEWRSVRCKCGAFSGRCQDHVDSDDGRTTTVYRFAKYAIRPVSATVELPRVPLSAFVVEDMNELALAHATYRFVVLDEEEERPRLLLWLFKPSLKLSYVAPKHYLIPQSGTVHAAKVLYKILGPATAGTELSTLLNRYPGFPQAEHLMYPKDVCTRIAVLLKESGGCYPESLRTMTGLDVGWLLRA